VHLAGQGAAAVVAVQAKRDVSVCALSRFVLGGLLGISNSRWSPGRYYWGVFVAFSCFQLHPVLILRTPRKGGLLSSCCAARRMDWIMWTQQKERAMVTRSSTHDDQQPRGHGLDGVFNWINQSPWPTREAGRSNFWLLLPYHNYKQKSQLELGDVGQADWRWFSAAQLRSPPMSPATRPSGRPPDSAAPARLPLPYTTDPYLDLYPIEVGQRNGQWGTTRLHLHSKTHLK
jgi:hypothetical protein